MGSSGEDVEGRPRLGLGLYGFTRVSYRIAATVTLYRVRVRQFRERRRFKGATASLHRPACSRELGPTADVVGLLRRLRYRGPTLGALALLPQLIQFFDCSTCHPPPLPPSNTPPRVRCDQYPGGNGRRGNVSPRPRRECPTAMSAPGSRWPARNCPGSASPGTGYRPAANAGTPAPRLSPSDR